MKQSNINRPMLERLLKIHREIESEKFPNTSQLAYMMEVSVPTISRDIEYMRDRLAAPIAYNAEKRGYFYEKSYAFPAQAISVHDAEILGAAKNLLSMYDGTPFYDSISSVIEMTTPVFESPLGKRIATAPTPRYIVDSKVWKKICTALSENCVLEFNYTARWSDSEIENEIRLLHPYQIVLDDGVASVFGFSEEREEERMFVISRMENVKVLSRKFELPKNYEFASRCGGGRFGAFAGGEGKQRFVVEFYNDARLWVTERIWASDQKITEEKTKLGMATVISFSTTQYLSVLEWVLSRGANARPRENNWLVKRWRSEIEKMSQM